MILFNLSHCIHNFLIFYMMKWQVQVKISAADRLTRVVTRKTTFVWVASWASQFFKFLFLFFFCSFEGSITKLVCIVYLIFPHANPHCHPIHHQWASCWLFILKYLHRVWPITGTQWMLVTESPCTKWTSLNLPKLNWYSQLKSFGLYIVIFIKLMIVQER